ncbi:MAG: hypothetical protein K0U84_18610 [Actinomycetia bacterium]|nr:hypothetical protein [Actinomycetes bacterium]
MNRNDVIDVLTVVAAATRRTVGESDVDVWQAVIGDCDKHLALQAVRDHLRHKPGVWLEPGHVYEGARAIRRDQLAREPDAMREARQKALEAKAAEQVQELADRKGLPTFERPKPTPNNPSLIRCPWCKAGVGQPCVIPRSSQRLSKRRYHPARIDAAKAAA